MIDALADQFQNWHGWCGLGIMAGLFVLGALTFVPRTPICIAGGMIFGIAAFPVALVGSTVGAIVAFLISRHLVRFRFLQAVERRPVWKAVLAGIDGEGWRLVCLLRLASPVPGTLTNYILGLTCIDVWSYSAATLVGSLPQVFLFVYVGIVGRAFVASSLSPLQSAALVLGLLFTALAVTLVMKRTRLILADHRISNYDQTSGTGEPPKPL